MRVNLRTKHVCVCVRVCVSVCVKVRLFSTHMPEVIQRRLESTANWCVRWCSCSHIPLAHLMCLHPALVCQLLSNCCHIERHSATRVGWRAQASLARMHWNSSCLERDARRRAFWVDIMSHHHDAFLDQLVHVRCHNLRCWYVAVIVCVRPSKVVCVGKAKL